MVSESDQTLVAAAAPPVPSVLRLPVFVRPRRRSSAQLRARESTRYPTQPSPILRPRDAGFGCLQLCLPQVEMGWRKKQRCLLPVLPRRSIDDVDNAATSSHSQRRTSGKTNMTERMQTSQSARVAQPITSSRRRGVRSSPIPVLVRNSIFTSLHTSRWTTIEEVTCLLPTQYTRRLVGGM